MRFRNGAIEVVDSAGVEAIIDFSLKVLAEVGMRIENKTMCAHLKKNGCVWDGEFGIKFPVKLMREYLEKERTPKSAPPPEGRPIEFSGAVGGYPLRWVDPRDCKVKPQTLASMIDLIKLADYLENLDTGIGAIGVPLDIPPLLQPLMIRFLDWRYAEQTLANSYIIWDTRLCPYILEFCQAVSDMEPAEKGGMKRFLRAHNYLVSPLKYTREEAAQFVWFWEKGYRCDVGNLMSMGGTAPATIAGSTGLVIAEMMALAFMHHAFYGDKGFHLMSKVAPLDMRSGYMPYGRPEQFLIDMMMGKVAEALGAADAPSFGTATGAKASDVECGLNKGFAAGLNLAMYGRLGWAYGKFSTDEVIDPRLMVLEDEFITSIKHMAQDVEVSADTMPLDVVKELGPGGEWLSHPHTFEHFRKEMWLPELFSGEAYEAWVNNGSVPVLEKARKKALGIMETYHPRGIRPETEEKLIGLMDKCAKELGITEYKRPKFPK